MENFGRVAKIFIDPKANEGYVSDGYFNKRVAVIDLDSGKIKRYLGRLRRAADRRQPRPVRSDRAAAAASSATRCTARKCRTTAWSTPATARTIASRCSRAQGKFVKENRIEPQTRSDGSVWDIAFSKDPQQQFLYMADGANEHVRIFDRKTMTELYNFGYGGRQPGMFLGVHSIAVDSKGNIYTTETYTGKRLQKFVYKGLGAVPKSSKVPAWPGSGN